MKRLSRGHLLCAFVVLLLGCLALWPRAVRAQGPSLPDIQEAIRRKGLHWVPKDYQRTFSLGLLAKKEAAAAKPPEPEKPLAGLPSSIDWRDHGGSFVSPVKDQDGCGSCWAFAAVAAEESLYAITDNTPGTFLDLSEQIVVSCDDGNYGCSGGWMAEVARFLYVEGTYHESCFPYTATDDDCANACSDWPANSLRIGSYEGVAHTVSGLKAALQEGPLAVTFNVYQDFDSYSSGVYEYATGDYRGGHAVLLIGYEDTPDLYGGGYFICKNSWGDAWGDEGFFKIGYSQLGYPIFFGDSAYLYRPEGFSQDAYEPDDSSAEAKEIDANTTQTHSIFPIGDEDWVTFNITQESKVLIETSGAGEVDDTRLWLYDENLQEIEYDDDNGDGLYSRISRVVGAGTYYALVDEYGDNGPIYSYNLSLVVSVPPQPVVPVTDDPTNAAYAPALLRLADGTLWAAYTSYRSGNPDLWYRTSTDEGRTWSAEVQLTNNAGADWSPSLAQAADGTVWLLWDSQRTGDGEIWFRTYDSGVGGWSAETQLTTDAAEDDSAAVLCAADGRVWAVWYSLHAGNPDLWFAIYDPVGGAWSTQMQLTTDTNSDYEPAIAQAADGKVWVVWYSYRTGNAQLWYKTSADGGSTWTSDTQLGPGTNGTYHPSMACASDGMLWVTWYAQDAQCDVWAKTSADNGGTWSGDVSLTSFLGQDYDAALAALAEGKVGVVWSSDRAGDWLSGIWFGIPGVLEDIDPPPYVAGTTHLPWPNPDSEDILTVRAWARDAGGISATTLLWEVEGVPQAGLAMYDDGAHNDFDAGDDVYGVQIGPFAVDVNVAYRVRTTASDGDSYTSGPGSFRVLEPFSKTASILFVADADPWGGATSWYTAYYTAALQAGGYGYDLWDAALRGEPDQVVLNLYTGGAVVWASPYWGYVSYGWYDSVGRLQGYLDAGGKLFLTGQNIADGLSWTGGNEFVHDYLHASFVQWDTGLYGLQGVAGDPVGGGLSLNLNGGDGANDQYSLDEIDPLDPAQAVFTYVPGAARAPQAGRRDAGGTPALHRRAEQGRPGMGSGPWAPTGPGWRGGQGAPWEAPKGALAAGAQAPANVGGVQSSGTAGLRVDTGTYRVVYFAFGFEGINAAADRATVMDRVLKWFTLVPPEEVAIGGPTAGSAGSALAFTATISPANASVPLTYVWQATGKAPITHMGGRSDAVSLSWDTAGTKVITLTAWNAGGVVSDTHTVEVAGLGMGFPTRWIANFGRGAGGWLSQNAYPRFVADVNADGRGDVVGFGASGVFVALSTGSSFAAPTRWIANFGTAAGNWTSQDRYPRMLADVNKDGRADVVGFGAGGVYVSLAISNTNRFAAPTRWLANFGTLQGWTSQDKYPRALADVNKDGRADVVGFGASGVYVARSTGTGFLPATRWIAAFGTLAGGWTSQNVFPRLVADVDGDGRADVVGFSMYGTYVARSTGTAFLLPTRWIANYGTVIGGWTSQNLYPRALGDVNGDGKADVVGFGQAGAYLSVSTGTSFAAPTLGVPAFGRGAAAGSWASQDLYPRTVADATGGGKADLVGFGNYGTFVAVSR